MRTPTVIFLLVASAGPAFALDQSVHQTISHDSCRYAGLPQDFCERVGTEAYNVDSYEWNDPAAHAQMGDGASACSAANAALDRERTLGSDIRDSLYELAVSPSEDLRIHIATQLGRSLHTIQDDCAHHGMPNVEHAWWSRLDSCSGSKTSPDAQPEAVTCANIETDAVFVAFKQQMDNAGINASALDDLSEGWTHWPKRADVCAFLYEADHWDGTARGWNNEVVVPKLRDQLTNALTVDDRSVIDACTVNVTLVGQHARLDVSRPPPMCLKLKTYCFASGGKADGESEAPPPWDDSADTATTGGCAVGGSDASWLLAMFGVTWLVRRPRRRAR
jgi:MYXO-CTERM domain-containing protein